MGFIMSFSYISTLMSHPNYSWAPFSPKQSPFSYNVCHLFFLLGTSVSWSYLQDHRNLPEATTHLLFPFPRDHYLSLTPRQEKGSKRHCSPQSPEECWEAPSCAGLLQVITAAVSSRVQISSLGTLVYQATVCDILVDFSRNNLYCLIIYARVSRWTMPELITEVTRKTHSITPLSFFLFSWSHGSPLAGMDTGVQRLSGSRCWALHCEIMWVEAISTNLNWVIKGARGLLLVCIFKIYFYF